MKKILVIFSVLAFCGVASAVNQMNTGCGLGTMLFSKSDDTKFMQIVVTCTNATTTNQSIGITLDIEAFGCSPTSRWVSADVEVFVQGNMDNLIRDIAVGQGETIESLAILMEVEDADTFGKTLQANFAAIFPASDVEYSHVADTIVALRNS